MWYNMPFRRFWPGLIGERLLNEFPAFDVAEAVITKICPVEFGDGVAEGGEGAADLAVATFAHLDDPAVVVAVVLTFQCQAAGSIR